MRNGRGPLGLHRRLEALENDFDNAPIVLYFHDGAKETLSDKRLRRLFGGVFHPETLTAADQRKLDAVRRCVRSIEPGGGQMVGLLRALDQSPTSPP